MKKNGNKITDVNVDEKELDDLFEGNGKKNLNRAIRSAKRRSLLRTVIISLLAVGITAGIVSYTASNVTKERQSAIEIALNQYYAIAQPNEYVGKTIRSSGIFNGTNVYTTYKIVGGKVVYTGQQDYSFGLLESRSYQGIESPSIIGASHSIEDLAKQTYNELGQREMVFFYPFITYPTYKQDVDLLNEIDDNKLAEIALSFDKSYSLNEIQKMMPADVEIAWYWVDDMSKQDKETMQSQNTQYSIRVLSEKNAFGIKAYDESGSPISNPEEPFISALSNSQKDGLKGNSARVANYKNEFNRIYNVLAGDDDQLTSSDLHIQGVVVTGEVDSLQSLNSLSFIKASSLGIVTDKY